MERKGLDILKKIYSSGGDTFLASQLFKTRKILTYSLKIPVGWLDYPNKDETYDINFAKTKRILILGQTGSGKTFISRALMNRAYLAGISPVIVSDLAPEYFTSKFVIQPELQKFILPFEQPRTFPMKIYYPYFLQKMTGFTLPEQILFQYNLDKINPGDLISLINFEEMGLSARLEIEDLIAEMMRNKVKFKNINELINYISAKKMSNLVKYTLIRAFKNLKSLDVFGDKYPMPDIISDINNNYIPDLNLFGWQSIDFKKYVALYITFILRELLSARQLGKLDKHLLLFFEELHEFAPKRPKNKAQVIVKEAIKTAVFTGRKEKISFVFLSQSPETIDPAIIEQCDYIFIPKGFERNKLMELVKNILPSYYDFPYEFGIRMANYMADLRRWRDGMREWLVLERGGELIKIAPIGPLSREKSEGDKY